MCSGIKIGLRTRFRKSDLDLKTHFWKLNLVWKYVFGNCICAEETYSEIEFGVRECVSEIKFESSEIESSFLKLNCGVFGNQI